MFNGYAIGIISLPEVLLGYRSLASGKIRAHDLLILRSTEEHFNHIDSLIKRKPDTAVITSFGIYSGIMHNGFDLNKVSARYKSRTKDMLDSLMAVPNVNILIGISPYRSCSGTLKCLYCQLTYVKTLFRLLANLDSYPDFKWRIIENLHAKLTLFSYNKGGGKFEFKGIIGGRNLNDSNWKDFSMSIEGEPVKSLYRESLNIIKDSTKLNTSIVGELLEKYKIEPRVMEMLQVEA